MYVDCHCHLDSKEFENELDSLIQKMQDAGFKIAISNGEDIATNRKNLELAKKYSLIKPALGIHPNQIENVNEKDFESELKFIYEHKDKIIAIGEVGLDYKYEPTLSLKNRQKEIFASFIDLSKKIKKPLIVHSRNAAKDVIEILEKNNAERVLLHSFSGNKKEIAKAQEIGYKFSITCNVVNNQNVQMLVDLCDVNNIMTESDSPVLAPIKGEINTPLNIIPAIQKIAELKGIDNNKMTKILFDNAKGFFRV